MGGNTIKIPKKYLKFFVKSYGEERYIILQGGRRSGKTFSTIHWLQFLCSGKKKLNIMIAAASASQLQATIEDWQDATGYLVSGNKVLGDHCKLPNGSVVQFKNFDEFSKCVGQKCDILFLNEAVNLDEKSFATLIQGVRHSIYLNYNPTRSCWVNDYIKQDRSNLLITTWQDNPYLSDSQKSEFERIKEKALSPTATLFDKYNYQVFYKGEFSQMGGKVFTQLFSCTKEEYDSLGAVESLGLDFGFVDCKDATTLIGAKVYDNCLYLNEYICSTLLTKDEDLAIELYNNGITCYNTIFADFGGMGKTRMNTLATAGNYSWTDSRINKGFNIVNAKKGKVTDGITTMLQFDKIIITEGSSHLRQEMENYELNNDGKEVSKHQNTIDAARYAVTSYDRLRY